MFLTLKNGAMIWHDSPEIDHQFQNNFKKERVFEPICRTPSRSM